MANMQRARQVILSTYVVGVVVALAFVVADPHVKAMGGFVLVTLAAASAGLLGIAMGVGSLLATQALVRATRWRAQELLVVGLGWLGSVALFIYAAALL
jgi:ethanolamine utilization microcompartment shell protein EutS